MSSQQVKIGIGVTIRKDGRILMGLRKGTHALGTWCCPGGHLEHGESFEDCARREVAEECGLTITEPYLGWVTNDLFPDGRHYVTLFMIADYISGEAQVLEPQKMSDWQWFNWDDLPSPLMLSYTNAIRDGYNPFKRTMALI